MASLANKDEAVKCRDMAKVFLSRGEHEKAVRFFEKSLKLYPLPDVQVLRDMAKVTAVSLDSKSVVPQAEQEKAGARRSGASSSSASSSASSSSTAGSSGRGSAPYSSTNGTSRAASNGASSGGGGGGESARASSGSAPGVRRRNSTAAGGEGSEGGSAGGGGGGADSAEEQACKKVLAAKSKGHYAVLGIEKDANEDQIKKAYRKLALKFHPDKNSAPSAHQAFQAIGTAFAVLSDADKRAHYDRFGDDDGPQGPGAGGPFGRPFGGQRYANEVSPEDIFNMFFGVPPGGAAGAGADGQRGGTPFRVYRAGFGGRQGGGAAGGGGGAGPMALLQMLPIILIMLYSLLGSGQQEAVFSLEQSTKFSTFRETSTQQGVVGGIAYFVAPRFRQTIGRDMFQLRRVEQAVTDQYKHRLRVKCQRSRDQKTNRIRQAKRSRGYTPKGLYDEELLQAESMPLPACDEYVAKFSSYRPYT